MHAKQDYLKKPTVAVHESQTRTKMSVPVQTQGWPCIPRFPRRSRRGRSWGQTKGHPPSFCNKDALCTADHWVTRILNTASEGEGNSHIPGDATESENNFGGNTGGEEIWLRMRGMYNDRTCLKFEWPVRGDVGKGRVLVAGNGERAHQRKEMRRGGGDGGGICIPLCKCAGFEVGQHWFKTGVNPEECRTLKMNSV